MKKRTVRILSLLALLSLGLVLLFTACSESVSNQTLTGITLTVDKTEVDIGETVTLGFTTEPEAVTYNHNGERFYYSHIEFHARVGDVDTKLEKKDDYSATYTVTSAEDVVFYAKYCEHRPHDDLEGDMLSPEVTVKIKAHTISSVDELKAIAGSNKHYALAADIDLSGDMSWQPIEGFTGKLTGGEYVIRNLTVNAVNQESVGLFGVLEGTVTDLTLENVSIMARGDAGKAGILAGTNKGLISNVTVSGSVSAQYYNSTGGIVGYNEGGRIVGCQNNATVQGANNVGGIVGEAVINVNNAVTACQNMGSVTGKTGVGGIAGYLTTERSNATYQITSNTNEGVVSGTDNVGGVFGEVFAFHEWYDYKEYDSYFEMSTLKNTAEVRGSATGNNAGGLIGKATRLNLLTTCENAADVSGGVCVGGFVGYAPDTNIKATNAANNSLITGKGKVGGFAGHAGVIEYAVNNGTIISNGVVVEDGKSHAYVGGIAGYCTGLIGCENNVDITVSGNGDYVGGLAGYVEVAQAEVMSGNVNNGTITAKNVVGGIAGYLTCIRSNQTYQVSANENNGSVVGASQVGGLFGEAYAFYQHYDYKDYNSYFAFSVLTNTASVTASTTGSYAGGLVGKANHVSVITTCENTGDVTGGHYVGGYAGYAPETNIKATGAVNNTTVTGSTYVGGFAGYAGLIEYAENNGTILATGKNEEGKTYVGGIAGYCTGVIGCVNNADISLENGGMYLGGIAGYIYLTEADVVRENVNTGRIKGAQYVGGIVGYSTCVRSNETYYLSDNQNQGDVQGMSDVGGIAGYVYAFYQRYDYKDYNSYYAIVNSTNAADVTGMQRVGGICGGYARLKTDANLMDTNTVISGNKLGQ